MKIKQRNIKPNNKIRNTTRNEIRYIKKIFIFNFLLPFRLKIILNLSKLIIIYNYMYFINLKTILISRFIV